MDIGKSSKVYVGTIDVKRLYVGQWIVYDSVVSTLDVFPSLINFDYGAGSATINVISNTTWDISK